MRARDYESLPVTQQPPLPPLSLFVFSLFFPLLSSPHYHSREELKRDTLRKGGDDEGSRLRKPPPPPPLSPFLFSSSFFLFFSLSFPPLIKKEEKSKGEIFGKGGGRRGPRTYKGRLSPNNP